MAVESQLRSRWGSSWRSPRQALPLSLRERTITDPQRPSVHVWLGHDPVTQLREWATNTVHPLPGAEVSECVIGSEPSAALRLVDVTGLVSRRHARRVRDGSWWRIEDLRSKNGLRQDREPADKFTLRPGVEIGIGSLTLIAENQALVQLRSYLARVLGWDAAGRSAVEGAIQAIRAAANQRRPLIIGGPEDLVAVARQIHLRTAAPGAPFVVCGDRPRASDLGVRITATHADPAKAFERAVGGTVCVRAEQMPVELPRLIAASRAPRVRARTRLIIDANETPGWCEVHQSIVVPTLAQRTASDLRRIIAEYASDAIRELDAAPASFTSAHREWVAEHAATSFAEIEIATLRLVARNHIGSAYSAAARLGLSHVGLSQWFKRRGLGP
jgi:hypothetical protein